MPYGGSEPIAPGRLPFRLRAASDRSRAFRAENSASPTARVERPDVERFAQDDTAGAGRHGPLCPENRGCPPVAEFAGGAAVWATSRMSRAAEPSSSTSRGCEAGNRLPVTCPVGGRSPSSCLLNTRQIDTDVALFIERQIVPSTPILRADAAVAGRRCALARQMT